MDFEKYQVEDFLADQSFLNYCLNLNEQDQEFWAAYKIQNPHQERFMNEAERLNQLIIEDWYRREYYGNSLEEFKSLLSSRLTKTQPKRRYRTGLLAPYLAAACVLIVFGLFLLKKNSKTSLPPSQAKITELYNRKKIKLPDGSKVILNANSTLTIYKGYNARNRILSLVGEAFFEVVKNRQKPFIVRTGKTSTIALGTSFLIRNYPQDPEVNVKLVTGKIKVELNRSALKKQTYLTPGMQISTTKTERDEVIAVSQFDTQSVSVWKANTLNFKDVSSTEIFRKLAQWYGVEIKVVVGAKTDKHFTGDFSDKSLGAVLEALSFTQNFEYKVINNQIEVKFKT